MDRITASQVIEVAFVTLTIMTLWIHLRDRSYLRELLVMAHERLAEVQAERDHWRDLYVRTLDFKDPRRLFHPEGARRPQHSPTPPPPVAPRTVEAEVDPSVDALPLLAHGRVRP